MLVASLVLMPASLVVKASTEVGEISPFFYWRLYYSPYSPDESLASRFVEVTDDGVRVVNLQGGAGYNKTTLESLMRGIVRNGDAEKATCLAASLGLDNGSYLLVAVPGAQLDGLSATALRGAATVEFSLIGGRPGC